MALKFSADPLPIINQGERHVLAVLLVDTSGSMQGGAIEELNRGLEEFGKALKDDQLAYGRAEVCIISFNSSVSVEVGFRPAANYEAPIMKAGGLTCLNEAIEVGLDAIESRKAEYKVQGVSYYRPWLFVLTDGVATDTERENATKERLRTAIEKKKVMYMPIGIGNVDVAKLQEYYPDEVQEKRVLEWTDFRKVLPWVVRGWRDEG